MRVRCPKCNRYGSTSLNGYCRACAPKPDPVEKPVQESEPVQEKVLPQDREYIVKDTCFKTNGFVQGKFIPGEYGIVKKEYGYQKVK